MNLGEMREIKRISGVSVAQIGDALSIVDPDVLAALVLIAMRRTGKQVSLEYLDALDFGSIQIETEEDEDNPPAEAGAASGNPETTPLPSGIPLTDSTSRKPDRDRSSAALPGAADERRTQGNEGRG